MAAATSHGCGLSLQPSTSVVAPRKVRCCIARTGSYPQLVGLQKCTVSSQSAILRFPSASMSLKGVGVGKLEISRVRRTGLSRSGARRPISAVAAPLAPPSNPLEDAGERQRLAEEYGFSQIGEPVPEGVTLKKVIDSFPPEVFEINDLKAWKTIAISVASYSLGLFMIAKAPWYLLPLAWAWTGTAITGVRSLVTTILVILKCHP
jgi:omega-6 fatty acid desaturase (delta-12 desaturase)